MCILEEYILHEVDEEWNGELESVGLSIASWAVPGFNGITWKSLLVMKGVAPALGSFETKNFFSVTV